MGIAISISVFSLLIAVVLRYTVFQQPIEKIKASWISFGFAVVATTICTLLAGGEQQSTLITGFATMILCYNIFTR